MSSILPSTPRRGTHRASQLRHVSSSGTSGTTPNAEPMISPSSSVKHDPAQSSKQSSERRCTLWIHEEAFCRDEVVLNLDHFPDVKAGDLMAVVALKSDSGVRDFQEKGPKPEVEGGLSTPLPTDRNGSKPSSPGGASGCSVKHDLDLAKQCLFVAKDMPKEMKSRQPGTEISVVKHVADTFHLKTRAQVVVVNVGHPSFCHHIG
jgi:hypothetical protein